jgi:hypothetical protein
MTFRTLFLALALAVSAAACDDEPTTPSNTNNPRFTAGLLAANEVPPVTNADQGATGTATVTLNLTRDGAGNITAATADFTVQIQGFPAGTTLSAGHIHTGAAGANGGIVWDIPFAAGDITLPNGSATFTRTGSSPRNNDLSVAQAIVNNPAAFYVNLHTPLNPGGAIRGQLVLSN